MSCVLGRMVACAALHGVRIASPHGRLTSSFFLSFSKSVIKSSSYMLYAATSILLSHMHLVHFSPINGSKILISAST